MNSNNKYKGLKDALILAMVAGLILVTGWEVSRVYGAQKAYTPSNLIRLHIIGNSQNQTDQEVKLKVRDAIMESFGQALTNVTHVDDAEEYILSNLENIANIANRCLSSEGFDYRANTAVEQVLFPDRTYTLSSGESIFLPQGYYKSLQVTLGKGEGSNWWCIMYPTLCYIDLVHGTGPKPGIYEPFQVTEGTKIDTLLIFLDDTLTKEVPIQVRFFFIDLIKKGFFGLMHLK